MKPYPHLSKKLAPSSFQQPTDRPEHPLFTFEHPTGLLTAEHPVGPTVPGGNAALKHDLDTMGVHYEEVNGRYHDPEHSFIVHSMPREHLIALGKKYGQEAVIHNENGQREFHYTNGPNAGKFHPGLGSNERWTEKQGAPEDYYTSIPGNGHFRLHFDFDQLRPSAVQPGAPAPTGLHAEGPLYATKHEALHGLYHTLKKALSTARPHPHAYRWHDGHTDHHYLGYGPGGVLISSKLRKAEEGNGGASSPEAGHTFHTSALPFGYVGGEPTDLKHYAYDGLGPQVDKLVQDHGYQHYYAGGKHGKPDLHNRNYNTGHLAIFDPSDAHTDGYRKVHELAHALTHSELNKLYGEGRRIGKLGRHRSLREAQRAVHWEWLAVHRQRELNKALGMDVPDDVFHRELNTVMHDAVHRAITGKFTEPSQEGFTPHAHKIPLETSLGMVREAARNLGLTGEHDLLNKSETGAHEVADDNKTLSIPEALHKLHEGLREKVTEFEQKCLDLRKAELAKAFTPGGNKQMPQGPGMRDNPARIPVGGKLPAYHASNVGPGAKYAGVNNAGPAGSSKAGLPTPVKKTMVLPGHQAKGPDSATVNPPPPPPPQLKSEGAMSMCKACGMEKKADHDCDVAEKYAKGEYPIKKDEPAGAGGPPDGPGVKDKASTRANKGPDLENGKPFPEKVKQAVKPTDGNDGTDVEKIKKMGMAPSAPKPIAPLKPAAGASPGAPKLAGLPKPGAPVGGAPKLPKPPAMGAGTPQMGKAEMKKASGPGPLGERAMAARKAFGQRTQAAQAAKLPGVRASVGGLMDNMLAAPKPAAAAPSPALPNMSGYKSIVSNPTPHGASIGSLKPDAAPAPGAQPGMFSPPPAAGRAVKLPGAHLTPPTAKPAMKSEKKPKGKK